MFYKKILTLALVSCLTICIAGNADAFKINTVTIEPPNGVSDFDLDYYIIFDDDGVGKIYHNTKATQDTLKVHKGDYLSGDIHPQDDEASSLKAFFTKSFKVKSHSLTFDKKYYLENRHCAGGNIHCNVFQGNVPSNIKKGNWQFFVFTSDEELYRYYITKAT